MKRSIFVTLAFFLCVACFGFDLTYMFTSITELRKQLNIKFNDIQWLVNIYVLFFITLLFPFSVLSAKGEKKGFVLVSVAGFCISTIIAFFSQDIRFFLIARALSGASFALLLPSSFGMVEKKLEFPFSLWILAIGIGLAIGPISAALIATKQYPQSLGFLIALPFALIAGLIFIIKAKSTSSSSIRYPDPFGLFVTAVATLIFVWGLIELPIKGILSIRSLGPLVIGIAGFVLFCFWEKKAKETILHTKNFFTREFLLSAMSAFILFFVIFIAYFLLPLYAKHILKLTKIEISLVFLFLALPLGILGYFLPKSPKATFKLSLTLSCILLIFGCYLQSIFQGNQVFLLIGALFVIGIASGIMLSAIDEEATHVTATKDRTKSFGQLLYFQALGLSFATALGGAFYRYEDILLRTKKFTAGPGSWTNQILSNVLGDSGKHKDYIGETINRFLIPLINKNFLEAYDHVLLLIMGFSVILLVLTLILLKHTQWKINKFH